METAKHDRPLVKYPEIAMTANSSGGYVASASSQYAGGDYDIWKAHDGDISVGVSPTYYFSTSHAVYSTTTGAYAPGSNPSYSTTSSGTVYPGEYVQMQFPKPIKLSHVRIVCPNAGATYNFNSPEEGIICGSNDGTTWTTIATYSGIEYHELGAGADIQASSDLAYEYIRIVVTHIHDANNSGWFVIEELSYYGYEEGDVSTDLTLSSVYNKPSMDRLEICWDANDKSSYPGSGTSVTDISGNSVSGTLSGVGFDSTYNAFTFDGSNDTITTTYPSSAGDNTFSISMWVKRDNTFSSSPVCPFFLGDSATGEGIGMDIYGTGEVYWFIYGGKNFLWNGVADKWFPHGEWVHLAASHEAGTDFPNLNKVWINGVDVSRGRGLGNANTQDLSLDANDTLLLGARGSANYWKGSIANFRIFSRPLNTGQANELYDWQKDHFLGSRSSMTLYKGHLGLGVAEPSSRFEVAGNAQIQEYPPRSMTGYETYIEGHGMFQVSESSFHNDWHRAWEAFGDNAERAGGASAESVWNTPSSLYSTLSTDLGKYGGNVITSVVGRNDMAGEWIQLETPHKVKVSSFILNSYADNVSNRQPRTFALLGSNDGSTWEVMKEINNLTSGYTMTSPYADGWGGPHHTVNSTKYYTHFRIVVRAVQANSDGLAAIGRVRFFGTPAPSSLDDGNLTLGKALITPRVSGHAPGAETPRAESLVIHYDTTVNSVVSGSMVADTSGSGNNGALEGDAGYSYADRALEFDGSADYIVSTGVPTATGSGNFTHTVSMWFKLDAMGGTNRMLWGLVGEDDGTDGTPSAYSAPHSKVDTSGNISWAMWGNDVYTVASGIVANRWYHGVWTYSGGTTGRKMFLDGVEQTFNTAQTAALNMQNPTSRLTIGIYPHDLATSSLNGSVSNFKLWNVALTADEITAEYALGRTGKALNVTDTAVCLGGAAPRAQLDVRGVVEVSGGIRGTDTTALTLHGCPMVTVSLGPSASSTRTEFDTEAYKGIWLAVLHRTSDRHGDTGLTTSAIIHKTNGISITTLHSSGYIAITNDGNSIKIGSGSAVSKNNLPGTYDFELKMVRLLQ